MNDFIAARLETRERLLNAGSNPYPNRIPSPGNINITPLSDIREEFAQLEPDTQTNNLVTVAGRLMFQRANGKIAFGTIQAGDGTRLQLMFAAADIGDAAGESEDNQIAFGKTVIKTFQKDADLGDHVWAYGRVSTSIRGELSIRVLSWGVASKAIRPLPFLHRELSDENQVRKPYLNWIQSDDARSRAFARSSLIREIRTILEGRNYLEIETPILQNIHGGAQARPFTTHFNALNSEMSLRIALELNLKKAVVGGFDRVFEIGKVFRNEGMDRTHLPEFTMLEAYEAYGDQYSMAELMQQVLIVAAATVNHTPQLILSDGTEFDLTKDFAWLSVYDAVSAVVGEPITTDTTPDRLQSIARSHDVSVDAAAPAGKIVMELCSELVEPGLIQPTFLYGYPAEAQPLARRNDSDPRTVEAWDLFVDGVEIGTAFTELIDPVIQREVLTAQSLAAANGDPEAMQLDEEFLEALEYGAPPMGGLGLGIDRLLTLLLHCNVRESVLFPPTR